MKRKKAYEAELFLNVGEIAKNENFIIFPESIEDEDYDELVKAICLPFKEEFLKTGIHQVLEMERNIQKRKSFPNPIEYKETSQCFTAQLKKGAILFRYGYDGRREKASNRIQYTVEGIFLKGIDLEKSKQRYGKIDIDIIKELESNMPEKIESIVISRNQKQFTRLLHKHTDNNSLENLFNDFYLSCYQEGFTCTKIVSLSPLYTISLIDKLEQTRRQIRRLFK